MPSFLPSLVAVLCWGAMFTVADTALDRVDAAHMTALRYAAASALFLALLAAVEGRSALRYRGSFARALVLGTVGFAGFNLLSFAALHETTPEKAALVVATMPLLTVLARWAVAGERPSGLQLGCVAAALAGVALVVTEGRPGELVSGGAGVGELMVLVATACWTAYTVGAAALPAWSPLRFTALTVAAGTLSVLVIVGAADAVGIVAPPDGADLAASAPQLVYVTLLGAVVGVLAWNAGVRRLGAADAALFMNLVPVTAFALEALRGARPGAAELAGAAVTLAALVVANLAGRRSPATGAAPAAAHPARPLVR